MVKVLLVFAALCFVASVFFEYIGPLHSVIAARLSAVSMVLVLAGFLVVVARFLFSVFRRI
jgi:hypothetical protein